MFCANCGKELETGSVFCPECGMPVGQPADPAQLEGKPEQLVEPPVQQMTAPSREMNTQGQPAHKKKSGRAGLIAVAAAFVLVVAAGVAGAAYYLSPEQKYNRAMNRADELMSEDAYSEAIAEYEKALDIQKSKEVKKALVKAYVAYAGELNGKKEYSDAVDAVEKAFKYDEDNADAQEELLTAYLGMGRQSLKSGAYEEAEVLFDKVMTLDGDNADAMEGLKECYIDYAEAAAEIGDYTNAMSYYRQVQEWDDTNAAAYRGIAHLTALQGDPLGAMSILEEGLMYNDGDAALLEEQNYLLEHTVKLSCETSYADGVRSYYECDAEGVILHSWGYDANGQLNDEAVYNSDGNCVSSKNYWNGKLTYESSCEYDGQGNLKRYYEYSSNGTYVRNSQTDYSYDDKSNLVWQRTVYNGNEDYYSETNNSYDVEGKLISSNYEYCDPTTQYYESYAYTYQYNEHGDITEEYWRDAYSDAFTSSEYTYQYDDRGRMVFKSCHSEGQDAWSYGDSKDYYTYDDEDRVIESREYWSDVWGDSGEWHTQTEYYADDTVSRRYTTGTDGYRSETYYNEQGNLISSETTYDGGNSVTYTTVEYDEHGHEVRRSVRSNDKTTDYAYVRSYNVFGDLVENYDSYYGKRTRYSYTYGLAE